MEMINICKIKTKIRKMGVDVIFDDGRTLFIGNTMLKLLIDKHSLKSHDNLYFLSRTLKDNILEFD